MSSQLDVGSDSTARLVADAAKARLKRGRKGGVHVRQAAVASEHHRLQGQGAGHTR